MTEQGPGEPDEQGQVRVRRRLESGSAAETKGRSGCLITGALLGIIVGATFAFYGLPPILKHFYGEQHVSAGATYEGDGKIMTISAFAPLAAAASAGGSDGFGAEFEVTINKTWTAKASDFSIELAEGGDWIEATGIGLDGATVTTATAASIDFDIPRLAEPHRLQLTFPNHAGTPKYLHLAAPRVRFALP